LPKEDELRAFLSKIFVEVFEFEAGGRHVLEAEEAIRNHLVADASQAPLAWTKIQAVFFDANQHGLRITPTRLREILAAQGIVLKPPPDYADDILRLRSLTERNLNRLREHDTLPFGPNDNVHIPREE